LQFLSSSHLSQTLFDAARDYLALGYSVIPVYGDTDPTRAKQPVIVWLPYQYQWSTETDLDDWQAQGFAGIAIVTGHISAIAVLDFDSPQHFADFHHQHPDLTQTYIVHTKRGFHLYFHLPSDLPLPSRKCKGVDLLSDGCYVIAPPTSINGHIYHVTNHTPPHTLTASDITRIQSFFDTQATTQQPDTAPTQATPRSNTAFKLTALYSTLAPQHGRNHALYTTARRARQQGQTLHQTLDQLTSLHIQQRPGWSHSFETDHQRHCEATRTIHSAYHAKHPLRLTSSGLPNSLREKLLQTQLTPDSSKHSCATARVLDAFLLAGWLPGKTFSEPEALQLCRSFGIGRDSLLKALSSTIPDGIPLLPRTPASGGASPDSIAPQARGRRLVRFVMPDIETLCQQFGVEYGPSDPLQAEDLASPQAYRRALERRLLERRPGQYPRQWLAERLGVSRWTLRRYHRDLDAIITPVYGYMPLTDATLNSIEASDRTWLQDAQGRRYPIEQGSPLLAQGQTLALVIQQPNYYRLPVPGEHSRPEQALWECPECHSLQVGTKRRMPDHCSLCRSQSAPNEREQRASALATHSQQAQVLERLRALLDRGQLHRQPLTQATVTRYLAPEMVEWWPEWWEVAWLEVEGSTKRYPPKPGLARRLIKQHGAGKVIYNVRYEA
jgi:hypothetical protein